MSIKALVYDIEIDILKIHYDPMILKLKKDLHLTISKIKTLLFSQYFYFFTIGKINFESYIKTSFNELILEDSYIEKLEKKYKKSFNYNIERKQNIVIYEDLFDLNIYFSADIDNTISTALIKKDPSLSKKTFFSSKFHAVKQEELFLDKLQKNTDLDFNQILIVDDNIDVLLNAKNKGYLTLFYNGKSDFDKMLKLVIENQEK